MLAGFVLLTLFVPGIATLYLQTTRVWWLPGVALIGVAMYLFATLDTADHGDDGIGASGGIGNAIQNMYGLAMLIYAAILLVAAWRRSKRAARARAAGEARARS
jgi:hypothetical protein